MQIEPQDALIILEGSISVEAALRAGSRPISTIHVRADKSSPAIFRIEREAERRGIPVMRTDVAAIDSLSSGGSHGGVIALAGPRRFVPLEELAGGTTAALRGITPVRGGPADRHAHATSMVADRCSKGWVTMIDGVEDPYNFGAAVRSAYAAGTAGLVVRERNWFSAAGLVARASAGASEAIPTAVAGTADTAAAVFRKAGYTIVCADTAADATSLYEADLTGRFLLLIGGEKRGVTRSFRDRADLVLRIPYGNRAAESLGTAAATAVIAFEILRQRLAAESNVNPSQIGQGLRRPPLLGPSRRRR